jgi:hypothetical protein
MQSWRLGLVSLVMGDRRRGPAKPVAGSKLVVPIRERPFRYISIGGLREGLLEGVTPGALGPWAAAFCLRARDVLRVRVSTLVTGSTIQSR